MPKPMDKLGLMHRLRVNRAVCGFRIDRFRT